ncbi:MAG: NlpC/P60 family protein [Caulobacteraceae bacterium]|nr:NlpC/P60 family protein [Caulobacteraceae bacterium]
MDPRLTLAGPGLAALELEGLVRADRFAPTRPMRCVLPAAAIRRSPDDAAEQMDQLLFGEAFDVLQPVQGFAWGQARRDGYVGFVDTAALAEGPPAPTHQVSAPRAYAFDEPSIKARPAGLYSMNALVEIEARDGRFAKARDTGWFVETQLSPIGLYQTDIAAVAERYVGAAYQWGGRESLGLDCSGLVQQAHFACGLSCQRDTDLQARMGAPIEAGDLRRGDLVFWRGHVGMMLDEARLIHANAHHMAVVIEPLAEAVARIAATPAGEPTGYRRVVGADLF